MFLAYIGWVANDDIKASVLFLSEYFWKGNVLIQTVHLWVF